SQLQHSSEESASEKEDMRYFWFNRGSGRGIDHFLGVSTRVATAVTSTRDPFIPSPAAGATATTETTTTTTIAATETTTTTTTAKKQQQQQPSKTSQERSSSLPPEKNPQHKPDSQSTSKSSTSSKTVDHQHKSDDRLKTTDRHQKSDDRSQKTGPRASNPKDNSRGQTVDKASEPNTSSKTKTKKKLPLAHQSSKTTPVVSTKALVESSNRDDGGRESALGKSSRTEQGEAVAKRGRVGYLPPDPLATRSTSLLSASVNEVAERLEGAQQPRQQAQRQPQQQQQRGGQQARVYAIDQAEAEQQPGTMSGLVIFNNVPVFALFDTGATHTFISRRCLDAIGVRATTAIDPLEVSLASGRKIVTSAKASDLSLSIGGRVLPTDAFVLEMKDFDLILGMDWQSFYDADIKCHDREITLYLPRDESITFFGSRNRSFPQVVSMAKATKLLRRGNHQGYLMSLVDDSQIARSPHDVPVVREFVD
ncbi:Unknown protein, partial [Striga hermonthica]